VNCTCQKNPPVSNGRILTEEGTLRPVPGTVLNPLNPISIAPSV